MVDKTSCRTSDDSICTRIAIRPAVIKKQAKKKEAKVAHDTFTRLCAAELHVECVKEYRFCKSRRWRFDYAIPAYKIAIEVEGGVWTQGRHTRPRGFLKDMEKYNTAALFGWRVFRTIPSELLAQKTIFLLKKAISS